MAALAQPVTLVLDDYLQSRRRRCSLVSFLVDHLPPPLFSP